MLNLSLEIIARILQFLVSVMDVLNSIGNLLDFGRLVATGRADPAPRVRVPPDPKPLNPAAERALAEAEARREARASHP
ncbi:MAG: hypothetical protein KDJ44_07890 [Rhodoblastus sp.]|nr:hypothetical protein [Rhodoblastus sp.]